jgi:hypothetical protein
MSETILTREENFDPIFGIATLSNLLHTKTQELRDLREAGSSSNPELMEYLDRIAREAVWVKRHYGISDEDFFEAAVQSDGWRERVTYQLKQAKEE